MVAFVGKPHTLTDRGAQVFKSLKDIGFDQYYQAEQKGWVLYVEDATDLAILQAFAELLDHPAKESLKAPFVHYVATNLPTRARDHFHGIKEAKPDFIGLALFDRIDTELKDETDCASTCGKSARSKIISAAKRCCWPMLAQQF